MCSIFSRLLEKGEKELSFTPEYGLIDGWQDSYKLDFGRGTSRKAANFPTDDMTLEKLGYQGHRSCLDFLLPVIPRYSGKSVKYATDLHH